MGFAYQPNFRVRNISELIVLNCARDACNSANRSGTQKWGNYIINCNLVVLKMFDKLKQIGLVKTKKAWIRTFKGTIIISQRNIPIEEFKQSLDLSIFFLDNVVRPT